MIFEAVQAVLMVVIIIAAGYFIARAGWAGKTVTDFISNLIVGVTLPCTAVMAFLTGFTAKTLADSWIYILASFAAIGVTWLAAKLVVKIAKIKKTQRGVFTALFSFSNSKFVGLPVATAIFGEEALVFALFYYVANTTFMNSLGFVEIARDGMELSCGGKGACFSAKDILKKIFKPPMIAVLVGFLLVMLNVRLPVFLSSALSYIGDVTSPLALMFVGMILQRTGISRIRKFDKGISWALVGRYLVSPLAMLGITACMGLPAFPSEVLTIQMSLPAMVTTTIFAEISGADTELAARGVAVTTLLSFLTIPIYILLFTYV